MVVACRRASKLIGLSNTCGLNVKMLNMKNLTQPDRIIGRPAPATHSRKHLGLGSADSAFCKTGSGLLWQTAKLPLATFGWTATSTALATSATPASARATPNVARSLEGKRTTESRQAKPRCYRSTKSSGRRWVGLNRLPPFMTIEHLTEFRNSLNPSPGHTLFFTPP